MNEFLNFISRVIKANEEELFKVVADEILLEMCEEVIRFVLEKNSKKEAISVQEAYLHVISKMKESCPSFKL